MVTIRKTARELAEIGEKSPGYSVQAKQGDEVYTLADIRFGRVGERITRNRVECLCTRPDGESKIISMFPMYEIDVID